MRKYCDGTGDYISHAGIVKREKSEWCGRAVVYSILFIIHIIMIYESDNTGHYKENVKYGSGGAEFKYASSAGGRRGEVLCIYIVDIRIVRICPQEKTDFSGHCSLCGPVLFAG
jgi:hypothetical protein